MRPRLDDVTICCVDTVSPDLGLAAIRRGQAQCDFGASVMLTDRAMSDPDIACLQIGSLSGIEGYSYFLMHDLPRYFQTRFVLIVQWDGFVADGSAWEPGFLDYDYIGSPWYDFHRNVHVGNGGFSLRSRRLYDALARPEFPPGHPEDIMISETYRPALEALGIRFADGATAARFSFEDEETPPRTFGFHGMYNLWRFLAPDEMQNLIAQKSPDTFMSHNGRRLLFALVLENCWHCAATLLSRIEAVLGEAYTVEVLAGGTASLETASAIRGTIYQQSGVRPPDPAVLA